MTHRLISALLASFVLNLVQAQDESVAPVTFSLPDQVFAETLSLELSCDTEGVVIRYSTDGAPPSLFNGIVYTGPIEIADTTWVRAEAIVSGTRLSSGVTSGQYIRLNADVQGFESPLPILVLENFGQGEVPSKQWNQTGAGVQQVARQRAQWFLFDREGSEKSQLTGTPTESSRLGVRVRGAFSSSFPRKPFSVEAWNELDDEMSINPLGMPAESDWVLYPPNAQQDTTLLYNTWLYALSRSLGGNAVRFRFTEAFVHTGGGALSMDDHAGVYVIMEKVKRDGDRLDFPKLSDDGATGGWLLSINRMDPIPVNGYPTSNGATEPQFFHTPGPNGVSQTPPNEAGRGDDIPRQANAFINFESPNGYEINQAQREAIEDWFGAFENVLYGEDFLHPSDGYRRYLDVDNFVDYFLLHDLTRNTDGLLISMWVYKEGPEAKLKMGPVWDYDLAYRSAATSDLRLNRNRLWYGRLWQDPDFEQRYTDRWQELRSTALSDEAIHALIDQQAAEITLAVAERHGVVNWPDRLTRWKRWITDRAGAIDQQFEPRPKLVQASGVVEKGASVSLRAGSIFSPRAIYVTSDGSDPRASGGGIGPQATLLGDGVLVEQTTHLKARVLADGVWSGLVDAWYVVDEALASAENLQISKIHYHPSEPIDAERSAGFLDADAFEFIELRNLSENTLQLAGATFADGINFAFDGQSIPPKGRLLVVQNRDAFALRYGTALSVAGEYSGNLRNSGERVALLDVEGSLISEVTYHDRGSWPRSADGEGQSLVRIESGSGGPYGWRPSLAPDGAPGVADGRRFEGVGDLVTFALGQSPPQVLLEEEQVQLRYQRDLAAMGLRIQVETSLNLVDWEVVTSLTQVDRRYLKEAFTEESFLIPGQEALAYFRLRIQSN